MGIIFHQLSYFLLARGIKYADPIQVLFIEERPENGNLAFFLKRKKIFQMGHLFIRHGILVQRLVGSGFENGEDIFPAILNTMVHILVCDFRLGET